MTACYELQGAFHLGKKKPEISVGAKVDKVVPFGRKPRYVAVPDGEPGTGTN